LGILNGTTLPVGFSFLLGGPFFTIKMLDILDIIYILENKFLI